MTEEAKIVSGRAAVSPVIVTGSTDSKSKDAAKKKEESDFPFAVAVLDVYEGPLDLLLDLIHKQDVDIYDIPIAKITAQYLSYVESIRHLDVNVAAEFIYMASVLIHIKSKTLLPRDPDAPAEEQEDPRAELVRRLLEYEKFKNAAQMLYQREMIENASWSNPGDAFVDGSELEPELTVTLYDLLLAFRDVVKRAEERP